MTSGARAPRTPRPHRTTISNPNNPIRGELRDWVQVYLNEDSYFSGKIYGDRDRLRKDGTPFKTGFIVGNGKIDRGDFWLIKTAGANMYMLYKNWEKKDA